MLQSKTAIQWPSYYIISVIVVFSTFAISAMTGFYYLAIIGAMFSALLITDIEVYKEFIAFTILLLISFQNFIIGYFGHIGEQFQNLTYLTQIPFIFLVFTYIFLILKRKLKFSKLTITILFIICSIAFAVSKGGNVSDSLLQVRNLTTFYFAFEVGRYSISDIKALKHFVKIYIILAYVMLFFGVLLLIGSYDLYKMIGIENVYFAKGLPGEGTMAMPGRFTTDIFHVHIQRMGSLYYEPVTLSYFFSAVAIFSYIVEWTKSVLLRKSTSIIMTFGILLTGGKGGMLIVASIIISSVLFKFFSLETIHLKSTTAFWISTVISFVIVGCFSNFYGQEYAGPAAAHFNTIEKTWQTIVNTPFGHGIAQGGFNSDSGNMEDIMSTGAESALMSFGYQLGIQGVLAIFLSFYVMTKMVITNSHGQKYLLLAFIPLTLFGASLFQLNTYTPQAIIPFVMLIGGNIADFEKERYK